MSFGPPNQNFPPDSSGFNQGFPAPGGGFDPGAGQGSAPQGIGADDYRFVSPGNQEPPSGGGGPRADLAIWQAPWLLLLGSLVYLAAAVYLAYFLTDRWITSPDIGREFDMAMGMGILGIVSAAVCTIVMLRGYAWGRWALTAWSAVALFALLHLTLWPVGVAGILGLILIWIPTSNAWLR